MGEGWYNQVVEGFGNFLFSPQQAVILLLNSLPRQERKTVELRPFAFVEGKMGLHQIPIQDRFWLHVDKSGDCWLWTGATDHNGYGKVDYRTPLRRTLGAHRISWMLRYGDIPNGLKVLHKCDNPKCVNPDHLFLGTHQDNMDDMVAKGRQKSLSWEEQKRRRG